MRQQFSICHAELVSASIKVIEDPETSSWWHRAESFI